MKLSEFIPAQDVPSLSGKTVVITGGTAGLGAKTIEYLAAHKPAQIYFTGRNERSADRYLNTWRSSFPEVPIEFVSCDLTALSSVSSAASVLLKKSSKLDIFIANAGIMAVPAALTSDGYESQFGTNHVGHALLMQKLLPALLAAPEPRIVSLTSQGYMLAPTSGIPYTEVKPRPETLKDGWIPLGRWTRYGNGKLANILYTEEIARRYPKLSTIAVHPGVIYDNGLVQSLERIDRFIVWSTSFGRRIGVDDGAKNTVWAATCDKNDIEGWAYAEPVGNRMEPPAWGKEKRQEHGVKLWEWTEKELQQWL